MSPVALAGLDLADPPGRLAALGFAVEEDGRARVGEVTLTLGIAPPGGGIVGWALAGLSAAAAARLDPPATRVRSPEEPGGGSAGSRGAGSNVPMAHPNGVIGIDHVVLAVPDLDAAADALGAAGLGLRRRTEIRGVAMGFRRLAGGPILEVVAAPERRAPGFWGLTFLTAGPAALTALAAAHRDVNAPRPAVQPGRRIATLARDAGLSTRIAFIDPAPDPPAPVAPGG